MSLHISGVCLGVTEDTRQGKSGPFTIQTAHILDGVHTTRVEFTKDYSDPMPGEGEFVVFDVYAFAYQSKAGNAGVDIKAHGRNSAAESAFASVLTGS